MSEILEKKANDFLGQEIKKRWKLLYMTRREGSWVCHLPNGMVGALSVESHHRNLRLTDKYVPAVKLSRVAAGYFRDSKPSVCEVTFSSSEIETIIPWIIENYVEVKSIHPAISFEYASSCSLGKPLGYVWTKQALLDS